MGLDFLLFRTAQDHFVAVRSPEELKRMNGYIMGSQNGEDGIIKKLFELFKDKLT